MLLIEFPPLQTLLKYSCFLWNHIHQSNILYLLNALLYHNVSSLQLFLLCTYILISHGCNSHFLSVLPICKFSGFSQLHPCGQREGGLCAFTVKFAVGQTGQLQQTSVTPSWRKESEMTVLQLWQLERFSWAPTSEPGFLFSFFSFLCFH